MDSKKNTYILCFLLWALSFTLAGCGSDKDNTSNNEKNPVAGTDYQGPDLTDVRSYQDNSPYHAALPECVRAETANDSCSLSVLPLIGQFQQSPTVNDVMERVVVSHAWMGERLREVLELVPPQMLELMSAVTAIVIDDDIRPSFYRRLTGAIYLDPAYLWLTNEEKETITKEDDYRSGYRSELNFHVLTRYVKDNRYAYHYYDLNGDEERALEDILYPLARLLFHELAHANDFFPFSLIASIDSTQTLLEVADALENERISRRLSARYPLTSEELKQLAQVAFRGEPATELQQQMNATQVGAYLEGDGANDDYSYFTIYEDVAMLAEESLMKYFFDIDRDLALVDEPQEGSLYCGNALVRWGNRNRIAAPVVKARARFVLENLFVDKDFSGLFSSLEAPIPMQLGDSWCSNLLDLDPEPAYQTAEAARVDETEVNRVTVDSLPPHLRQ